MNQSKQITSWSFSRYSDYSLCPLKAKLKHLDKIAEPGNDAMVRGGMIHKAAELYIIGVTPRLPTELKAFGPLFKSLRSQYKKDPTVISVEQTWALTKTWTRTVWNDWDQCWLRIKLDCARHIPAERLMVTYDWKTGRYRENQQEEYLQQLELYALAALVLHEAVDRVHPKLIYLDAGIVYPTDEADPLEYTRKDISRLKKAWIKRTKAMMKDKRFAPRPNDKCRWCYYRADNKSNGGGQCKF